MQKSLNILSRVRSSPNTEAPKSEDIMTKSLVSPATREVAADTVKF